MLPRKNLNELVELNHINFLGVYNLTAAIPYVYKFAQRANF